MIEVRVTASVVAELLARLPGRLVRKLESAPDTGRQWARHHDGGTLVVQAGEDATVTIQTVGGAVDAIAQISCTCLLSPVCLHVAAVVRTLPLDVGTPDGDDASAAPDEDGARTSGSRALTPAQLAAAHRSSAAVARLLATGAANAGLVVEAELLRAAQACRAAGLPRIAGALLRTVQRVRDLHAEHSDFRLDVLVADVADAAITAGRLARDATDVSIEHIGRNRRTYEKVGNFKLTGLFCEPVISAAGYAGIVTYLMSGDGRCWTVSTVTPGDISNVGSAYTGPVAIGDASLSHRSLASSGLHLSGATASVDGRLGSGRDVKAVTRAGEGWSAAEVDTRFRLPLEEQLAPPTIGDLVFLRATVEGADGNALVLTIANDSAPIRALAPVQHDLLPAQENLGLLAAAPGLSMRAIGRVEHDTSRTIRLLAISSDDLVLPLAWRGRVNIALDRLERGHVPMAEDHTHLVSVTIPEPFDPLDPFRRRLHRAVYGGRSTCGPLARGGMAQDALKLANANMHGASSLLRAMAEAAGDSERFAHAWAGAAVYESACTTHMRRGRWMGT